MTRMPHSRTLRGLASFAALLVMVRPFDATAGGGEETPPGSVYKTDPRIDLPIVIAGFLSGLELYTLDARLARPSCPCDPGSVNAFDRTVIGNNSGAAAVASDFTVGLTLLGPLLADGLALRDAGPFKEDATVFLEALAVNTGLVTVVKFIVQRPLPITYDPADPALVASPGGYRSFFSGHTSLAFAALSTASMTIGLRYGSWKLPWVVTALVGTSVGLERVAAGRHFYSDVIVGMLAGTAIGVSVPLIHRRKSSVFLRPLILDSESSGVAVGGPL